MEKFKNVPSIRVEEKNGMQLVSARELYKKLELKKRFSAWVEQNFKEFEENEDSTTFLSFKKSFNSPSRIRLRTVSLGLAILFTIFTSFH